MLPGKGGLCQESSTQRNGQEGWWHLQDVLKQLLPSHTLTRAPKSLVGVDKQILRRQASHATRWERFLWHEKLKPLAFEDSD